MLYPIELRARKEGNWRTSDGGGEVLSAVYRASGDDIKGFAAMAQVFFAHIFIALPVCLSHNTSLCRRGGKPETRRDVRVVEGARLESAYTASVSWVRIPLSPPVFRNTHLDRTRNRL